MENPFLISNEKEYCKYIESINILNTIFKNNTIFDISKEFNNIYSYIPIKYIKIKLKEFNYNFNKGITILPINYILMGLNYDGIYNKYNNNSILFVDNKVMKKINVILS